MTDKFFWPLAIVFTYGLCEGVLYLAPGLKSHSLEQSIGIWGIIGYAWVIALVFIHSVVPGHE